MIYFSSKIKPCINLKSASNTAAMTISMANATTLNSLCIEVQIKSTYDVKEVNLDFYEG